MIHDPINPDIRPNDIRIVRLPVKCIFKWSDSILVDHDERMNPVYESGWIMEVLPGQAFDNTIVRKIESQFYANVAPL